MLVREKGFCSSERRAPRLRASRSWNSSLSAVGASRRGDLGEARPGVDARVVAVGEHELQGVVAYEPYVADTEIVRYGCRIEQGLAGEFVDAACASACEAKVSCGVSFDITVRPGDHEDALGSLEFDIRWCSVHWSIREVQFREVSFSCE